MLKRDGLVVDSEVERVDWDQAQAKLGLDDFDNGRTAEALRHSFK